MRTLLIALSALALASTANAATPDDFVVVHRDLDLSNKHDQETLKNRIASEARDYCKELPVRTGGGSRVRDEQFCVSEATKLARQQMATLVDRAAKGG